MDRGRMLTVSVIVVLLAVSGQAQAGPKGIVGEAVAMGILPATSAGCDGQLPMTHGLWALLLETAFGHFLDEGQACSLPRCLPAGPEGARISRVYCAGWMPGSAKEPERRPTAPIIYADALGSLLSISTARGGRASDVAVTRKTGGLMRQAARTSDASLTIDEGLSLLYEAMATQELPAGDRTSPLAVVRGYYALLSSALGYGEPAPISLAELCCGSALEALQSNLPAAAARCAFRLTSLQVVAERVTGHLATVQVRRAADQQVGPLVRRTETADRFELRYCQGGWRIFR